MTKKIMMTVETAMDNSQNELVKAATGAAVAFEKAQSKAKDTALGLIAKAGDFESKETLVDSLYKTLAEELPTSILKKVKQNKDGVYQFRSCPETKVIWQWGTVVAKAVENGAGWSDIFEMEDNKLPNGSHKFPTRAQIYNLCEKKSDTQKLIDLLETCVKIAPKISKKADKKKVETKISELMEALG